MKKELFQSVLLLFLLASSAFLIHKLAFYFLNYQTIENQFQYSIFTLYSFFIICSLIIIVLLFFIKRKEINNVGNSFMLLTILKMPFAYFLLHSILNSSSKYASFEKINFFIIFLLFLAIETIVSIRILNNKQ